MAGQDPSRRTEDPPDAPYRRDHSPAGGRILRGVRSLGPTAVSASSITLFLGLGESSSGPRCTSIRCPGDGWRLLAAQGKRGVAGERGPQGPAGPPAKDALTIERWQLDRTNYRAIPVMSDGSMGPALDLRGLFEQFFNETSA